MMEIRKSNKENAQGDEQNAGVAKKDPGYRYTLIL
jgi:hypothetical protein